MTMKAGVTQHLIITVAKASLVNMSSFIKVISLTLDPGSPGGPVGPASPSSPKGPRRPLSPCLPGGPKGPCTQTQQDVELIQRSDQ